MGSLLIKIIAGILGLWLAVRFVPDVEFTGTLQSLAIAGAALGIINALIKPLLRMITLPLRIITLGLFGLVINLAIVWASFLSVFVFLRESFAKLEINRGFTTTV